MLKVHVWFMTDATGVLPVIVDVPDSDVTFESEIEKQDYVLDYLLLNSFSDKEGLTFNVL